MHFHHLLSHHVLSPASLLHIFGHAHPHKDHHSATTTTNNPKGKKKQSSLQTIFCVWNTMLGSTLLTMPWGFAHAGIIPGIALTVFLYLVALYTCLIVIRRGRFESTTDFSSLCRSFVGGWAHRLYQVSSVLLLFGALIAYHNFITSSLSSLIALYTSVSSWIPALASALVVYLLSIRKDPKLLVQINSFGILSVWLTMFFVIYEGSPYGQASEVFSSQTPLVSNEDSQFVLVPKSFSISSIAFLSGILGMSFFIHNAILPIIANNAHHEHDERDVTIAFTLALVCYLAVGLVPNFFVNTEALKANQNFLGAFPGTNPLAIAARSALVWQLTSVYPLVLYFIRAEIFGAMLKKADAYPGLPVLGLTNLVAIGITGTMAVCVPQVGTVLSWSGAIMGFVLLYLLPPLVEFYSRIHPHVFVAQLGSVPDSAHPTKHAWSYMGVVVFVVGVGLAVIALQIAQALS